MTSRRSSITSRAHDSPTRADYVLDQIESAFQSLSEHPQRGSYPGELLDIGSREYREVFFKPYRIIYRVIEETVYVLVIADGRRDMQLLLQRRACCSHRVNWPPRRLDTPAQSLCSA